MAGRINRFEKMLGPKTDISANSIDDNEFLKYMYQDGKENENKYSDSRNKVGTEKASTSFLGNKILEEKPAKNDMNLSAIETGEKINSAYKNSNNNEYGYENEYGENDDDMTRLGKLSLINMGARYELLNANRMLVDLDISLRVFFCYVKTKNKKMQNKSTIQLNEGLMDTKTMFSENMDKYMNPVKMVKMYDS